MLFSQRSAYQHGVAEQSVCRPISTLDRSMCSQSASLGLQRTLIPAAVFNSGTAKQHPNSSAYCTEGNHVKTLLLNVCSVCVCVCVCVTWLPAVRRGMCVGVVGGESVSVKIYRASRPLTAAECIKKKENSVWLQRNYVKRLFHLKATRCNKWPQAVTHTLYSYPCAGLLPLNHDTMFVS